VASESVDVKRTCSAHGTAEQISSASWMMGSLTMKYVLPPSICARTAATTAGWAWPRISGPEART
jgi:hypothetical protein